MAFTTTQTFDAILLNNLLFRNTANAPISSFHTIYANGRGQTFWGPAVQPNNLSTLSTVFQQGISSLSTNLLYLTSTFTIFSTQTFPSTTSTLTGQLLSTSTQLSVDYATLNNQFVSLSNNTNINFTLLSNNVTNSVNLTTSTTIGVITSTISGIPSISSYTSTFNDLLGLFQSGSSTLSTAIYVENQNTISTLSSYIESAAHSTYLSSVAYTDSLFSTLSSNLVTSQEIAALSTSQNLALVGYVSTFASTISTNYGFLSSQLYEFSASTLSTQVWITSTLPYLSTTVSSLSALSSQISTQIYSQIVSYVEPMFVAQDLKFSQYTSTLTAEISSISTIAFLNRQEILFISTYTNQSISTVSSVNTFLLRQISSLTREFSILTTSSILAGIYDSFYDLSSYTSFLVQSTINTIIPFRSSVFFSTSVQNASTGLGYYNAYVSSVYLSTLSTMIPITSTFVSSLIGNLYSTGSVALLSSIDSTIFGKSAEFQSTNSSLTRSFILSSQTQFVSSIASYLSTPAGIQLSTFSNLGAIAISTFQAQGASTLQSQSTLFGAFYTTNSSTISTQTGVGGSLISTLSTSFVNYSSTFSGLLQSIQISSSTQLGTQNTQFISTMISYQNQFSSVLQSTNNSVLMNTTTAAGSTITAITTSTTTFFNAFAQSLANSGLSSISTLFTNQTINLTGTNFLGTLDFANFANFTVNIQAPLVTGSSNYRVTYNSNQIANLNYRRGFITVDVSTITTGYGNNNGRLALDTYRSGLPTTIYNEFYPSISSCDYTTVYSYTILNNIVYTNLLNVFPRLRVSAVNITTGTNTNITGSYWRGSAVNLTWSNYSFFPIHAIGAPAFSGEVLVDVLYNNVVQSRNGPYPLTVSSAMVQLPYLTGAIANPAPVRLRTYIVGKPMEAVETNVSVILPQLLSVQLTAAPARFLAFNEISAFSDAGVNMLPGIPNTNIFSFDGSGSDNAFFLPPTFYFDAAFLGHVEVNANPDFALGTGDFTIEWFQRIFNNTTFPTVRPIFTTVAGGTQGIQFTWNGTAGSDTATLTLGGSTYVWTGISGLISNWRHIAISRQGVNLRLFVNGVVNPIVHTSSDNIPNSLNLIFGRTALLEHLYGFLTNIRWLKGSAIYSANFSVPTTALTPVTNTRLLLCTSGVTPLDVSGTSKVVLLQGGVSINYGDTPFSTGYAKRNAVDQNPNTNFVSGLRQDNPASINQWRIDTSLGNSLTSISSITLRNIVSVSSFLRANYSTFNDSQELEGATMAITAQAGGITYQSSITLRSSIFQSFSL